MAQPKTEITVVPADENDTLALSWIESRAFDAPSPYALRRNGAAGVNGEQQQQPLSHGRLMFGVPSAEKDANRSRTMIERMKNSPDYHIYKAVMKDEKNDGQEKIVGFAAWRFCADTPYPAENTWKDLPYEGAANPRACNDFFGAMDKLRTKNMGGKRVACMSPFPVFFYMPIREKY